MCLESKVIDMDKEERIRIVKERTRIAREDMTKLKESITGSYCDGSINIMGHTVVNGRGHCSYGMIVKKHDPDTGLMDFISQVEYLEDDRDESYIEFLDRMGDEFIIVCPYCNMATASKVSMEDAVRRWNEGEVEPLRRPVAEEEGEE